MEHGTRHGTVVSLRLEKGFGFIHEQTGEPDIFFHCSDLVELPFDATLHERRVRFDVTETAKGLRATNIQTAN